MSRYSAGAHQNSSTAITFFFWSETGIKSLRAKIWQAGQGVWPKGMRWVLPHNVMCHSSGSLYRMIAQDVTVEHFTHNLEVMLNGTFPGSDLNMASAVEAAQRSVQVLKCKITPVIVKCSVY